MNVNKKVVIDHSPIIRRLKICRRKFITETRKQLEGIEGFRANIWWQMFKKECLQVELMQEQCIAASY